MKGSPRTLRSPLLEDEFEFRVRVGGHAMGIEQVDQSCQHCSNSRQHLFPWENPLLRHEAFGHGGAEAGSALDDWASSIIKKLRSPGSSPLSISLCRVEQSRKRRPIQLVKQLASIAHAEGDDIVQKIGNPRYEFQLEAVDVQFFMIKQFLVHSEINNIT